MIGNWRHTGMRILIYKEPQDWWIDFGKTGSADAQVNERGLRLPREAPSRGMKPHTVSVMTLYCQPSSLGTRLSFRRSHSIVSFGYKSVYVDGFHYLRLSFIIAHRVKWAHVHTVIQYGYSWSLVVVRLAEDRNWCVHTSSECQEVTGKAAHTKWASIYRKLPMIQEIL